MVNFNNDIIDHKTNKLITNTKHFVNKKVRQ